MFLVDIYYLFVSSTTFLYLPFEIKSVNLDSWTAEQVQSMRVMGNKRAKQVYEAELPEHFRRPQTDQALESFIRAKYEHKRYIIFFSSFLNNVF